MFGVPTLRIGTELFWGVDAIPMAEAYLGDRALARPRGDGAAAPISPPASSCGGAEPYSAAALCWRLRAYCVSASSGTGSIGVKSVWAIHSGRVGLRMWFETAFSVR